MSIWIKKTVNKEEQFVRLLLDNISSMAIGSDEPIPSVLVETMKGEKQVFSRASFFSVFDRTEYVDFIQAYIGQ